MSRTSNANDGKALPFHLQFVAGAVAGISEIVTMYPLDGTHPPVRSLIP